MKAYPVNALEAAAVRSDRKAAHSKAEDLYNKYLAFTYDFLDSSAVIEGEWESEIPFNSFILANSNASSGTFVFYDGKEEKASLSFNGNEYIKILEHAVNNRLETVRGNRFRLELRGEERLYIGYAFAGEAQVFPRFTVGPAEGLDIRSEGGRTHSGQVTGIPSETLRSFSCSFARVENEGKKLFDRYLNGVQNVVPHVIDPYYEAHDEFPPMFCTVSGCGEKEKRGENGFYWNFSISWQEAK